MKKPCARRENTIANKPIVGGVCFNAWGFRATLRRDISSESPLPTTLSWVSKYRRWDITLSSPLPLTLTKLGVDVLTLSHVSSPVSWAPTVPNRSPGKLGRPQHATSSDLNRLTYLLRHYRRLGSSWDLRRCCAAIGHSLHRAPTVSVLLADKGFI